MLIRFILSFLLFTLSPCALVRAQGLPTGAIGWYNGDCQDGIPGKPSWYVSDQQFARTYDDFVVPAGGWMVAGVFSIEVVSAPGVTEAVWEIRSGVSAGSGGAVVASGRSPATQTLLDIWPDGERVYRIEVDGLRVQLAAGTYWLSVSPVINSAQNYVCASIGANAIGSPRGNDNLAYYYDEPGNTLFQLLQSVGGVGASGAYSFGVLTSSAVPPTPSITGLANAASWQTGAVSPGEIVTIAGTALGPSAASSLMLDQIGRVSTSLNGVKVLFGAFPAPEVFVSEAQINAVVPYEVSGAATSTVQVVAAGQASNLFPVTVAPAAPALFTANGSGTGPAAALNQDYSYNGPKKPAAKGSYVTLFLTGEGQTGPAGTTGKITTVSPAGPLTPQPALPVTVSIGGQSAYIAFYGEAPGDVSGVLQIDVVIPASAPSGDLPLSVSFGPYTTPSGVTISVQ